MIITAVPIRETENTMTYTPLPSIKEQEEEETRDTRIIVIEVNSPQLQNGITVVTPSFDSISTSTPVLSSSLLLLTDDELWEPWFSFPSQRGVTLLRWAGERKSELLAYTRTLNSYLPITIPQYQKFQQLSCNANSSYKLLILGSILLIRGVSHGTLMGRMLFGRLLGERMADVMFFTAAAAAKGDGILKNQKLLERSILEAKGYQIRANELFSLGKYAAALEHLALAMIKLVPWDGVILPLQNPLTRAYIDLDLLILLSIAKTSSSLSSTLSPINQLISSNSGSRLYRLSHAACEAVRLYPYPYPSPYRSPFVSGKEIGIILPTPPPSPILKSREKEKDYLDPIYLADILDKKAEKLANVTTIEDIKLPNITASNPTLAGVGYISPRQIRRAWDDQ